MHFSSKIVKSFLALTSSTDNSNTATEWHGLLDLLSETDWKDNILGIITSTVEQWNYLYPSKQCANKLNDSYQ